MTGGLIDGEQEGFRTGRCIDQIFTLKQIGEKAREKKHSVYVDYIDFKKAYDRVKREAFWQVLRMYNVCCKFLSGIKSMYVDSFRVKSGKSKQFRINSDVRQGCIMFSWLFNTYGYSDEGGEDGYGKERSEIP